MRLTTIAALFLWVFSFALSTFAQAQQSSAFSPAATAEKLPVGLQIPAALKVTLSSKKSKVGDPVKLEVAADVHDQSGAVVLPRHAMLTGHVIQVARYQKNKEAAMLSFIVDHAEWKGHSAVLDAPVYGADVLRTDLMQTQMVDGFKVATLSLSDPLNLVKTETMEDTRGGAIGGYAHAVRDQSFHTLEMQLMRVPNPAIRTTFMKTDGDLKVPSEWIFVLLNGMNAGQ